MKRQYLRCLMALVGFAAVGTETKSQVLDQIAVTIPFEFSVAGKTLPAGTYRVNRVSDDNLTGLVLSSFENRASAIVLPTYFESASSDKAQVTFETVGDQHFLSKVKTGDYVFMIPTSHEAVLKASAKSHPSTASGNSAGSN